MLSAVFRPDAAEKRAALLAAIWIVSPVAGLRPSRAERSLTLNLPKPETATSPPPASSLAMALNVASTASFACDWFRPASSATFCASSCFVIPLLPVRLPERGNASAAGGGKWRKSLMPPCFCSSERHSDGPSDGLFAAHERHEAHGLENLPPQPFLRPGEPDQVLLVAPLGGHEPAA